MVVVGSPCCRQMEKDRDKGKATAGSSLLGAQLRRAEECSTNGRLDAD